MELFHSPVFTNAKGVEDEENDSFYHQIRGSSSGGDGMNPILFLDEDDVQVFECGDSSDGGEEEEFDDFDNGNEDVQFPTAFDENMFDIAESWVDDVGDATNKYTNIRKMALMRTCLTSMNHGWMILSNRHSNKLLLY